MIPGFVLSLVNSTAGRIAIGVLVVLIAAGALYACGKSEGRTDARVESVERTLEAVETRREVEDDTARVPDPVGRLHERGWVRD